MAQYLRPGTLFALSKFESYLNQPKQTGTPKQAPKPRSRFNNYEGRKWDYEKLEKQAQQKLEASLGVAQSGEDTPKNGDTP